MIKTKEEIKNLSFREYLEYQYSDYTRIRDTWRKYSPNWETYDLVVREYQKLIERYAAPAPQEEWPLWPIGGYAPGRYMCKCVECKNDFEVDKRAVQCPHCVLKAAKERIKELEEWVRQAIAVIPDLQEIGKLLNLPLGSNVSPQIVPKIKELQAEIERLKEQLRAFQEGTWYDEKYVAELQAENERLNIRK